MFTSLRTLAIISAFMLVAQPLWAGGGGSFTFRAGSGRGGRGGAPAPQPQSNQQQFFNQSAARQQSFFAQPVFPHSNFSQTQFVQPAFVPPSATGVQQVWINPPVSNYLPPPFSSGYQPGFYVAPTYFSSGTTILTGPTTVFVNPQPTSTYFTPRTRPNFGMIGRW